MKKTVSAIMAILVSASLLLTSCLGDSDNSTSGTGFMYVTQGTTTSKIGVLNVYGVPTQVSHSAVSNLSLGDMAYVTYTIKSSDYQSSGVVSPESLLVQEGGVFPSSRNVYPSISTVDTTMITEYSNVFGGLALYHWSPYTSFGDREVFSFTCRIPENEDAPRLEFYYDESKQGNKGVATEEFTRIIDVRMKRYGNGTGENKTRTFSVVADFSTLRGLFNQYKNDNNVMEVKFRFFKFRDSSFNSGTLTTETGGIWYYSPESY